MAKAQDVVITYETLFELYRREKNRDELQVLESVFFEQAIAYMKELKKPSPELSDDARERNRSVAFNIRKLLTDIYARRERKIVNMALIRTVTPNSLLETNSLLAHEKLIFEGVCAALQAQRTQVLSLFENNHAVHSLLPPPAVPLSAPVPVPAPESRGASSPAVSDTSAVFAASACLSEGHAADDNRTVPPAKNIIRLQFKEDQPKFIGPNLEIYGPYTIGDTAELPKIIADIILETGKAESV